MSGSAVYAAVTRGWSPDLARLFPEERFRFVEETGSTNDDLLRLLRDGPVEHLTTIQTDHQLNGRGRRGDKWEAPAGTNLLFSIALRLPEDKTIWTRLPHLTAYIVGKAVESILPGEANLRAKWPNDLIVNGKKLGGILVETFMTPDPFAVVGVGLNVNMRTSELPEDLQEIATSIYESLGCESSRSFLMGLIIQGFIQDFPSQLDEFEKVLSWLERRSFLMGKTIRVSAADGSLVGKGHGLGPGGELLLEMESGELQTIISAEKIEIC
ncbi:MAG: biotin--[acetyl-CoA-carboxylase] ligase [Verrucomicrobiales bacterium]|nr:biotin--[acetyl-CoA-carboxylase] ligase [Verrucomicrobiales bacterium]